MKKISVTVAGGGSWGTALAHLLALSGHTTHLWLRNTSLAHEINLCHENRRYFPGVALAETLRATSDPKVLGTEYLISAIPCQQFRPWLCEHLRFLAAHVCLVNAAKGIERGSLALCSAIFQELLPKTARYAVLSGPSFAADVLRAKPTAVVLACEDNALGAKLRSLFAVPWFRCYGNRDVKGVELGGALKNVMAIAAGICDGLDLGHNSRSALVTRALAEMSRIGQALGASQATFMGLSGLGDLVLTCTGDLSRNRQVGLGLGRGERLAAIIERLGMVAEGVATTQAVHDLVTKLSVEAPLTEAVYRILYAESGAEEELRGLLARRERDEED